MPEIDDGARELGIRAKYAASGRWPALPDVAFLLRRLDEARAERDRHKAKLNAAMRESAASKGILRALLVDPDANLTEAAREYIEANKVLDAAMKETQG